VAEVAEHLGVCNATVYRLCERGELRHVWIVNSIRIRPDDLREFLDCGSLGRGEPEPRH
jgi:excisionase family DNA binding protein